MLAGREDLSMTEMCDGARTRVDPPPRAKPEDGRISSERLVFISTFVLKQHMADELTKDAPSDVITIVRREKLVMLEAYGSSRRSKWHARAATRACFEGLR